MNNKFEERKLRKKFEAMNGKIYNYKPNNKNTVSTKSKKSIYFSTYMSIFIFSINSAYEYKNIFIAFRQKIFSNQFVGQSKNKE